MVSPPVGAARGRPDAYLAFVLCREPQIGACVREALIANGFSSRQFCDAELLLTEVVAEGPDLILLDWVSVSADVDDLMAALSSVTYQGKVLPMIARAEVESIDITRVGARRGLVMLPPLEKPFRIAELKRRLREIAAIGGTGGKRPARARSAIESEALVPGEIKLDLADILDSHWLELWYQPKIDLELFSICGAEALLRVRHPKHGIIFPNDFLPLTSDPLDAPLFRVIVDRALSDWMCFADQNPRLTMSLNVPASVVVSPDFGCFLRASLPKDPRFPGLLIEINEHEIIGDRDSIHAAALQLNRYNVRISIDAFGATDSSLSRLHDLPFAELKLDRNFVSECASNPFKHGLCQVVVDLARHLGVSICAQGVEAAEDLQSLMTMGCHTAQGFLFAPAMPSKQFAKMLSRGDYLFPREKFESRSDRKTDVARKIWAA